MDQCGKTIKTGVVIKLLVKTYPCFWHPVCYLRHIPPKSNVTGFSCWPLCCVPNGKTKSNKEPIFVLLFFVGENHVILLCIESLSARLPLNLEQIYCTAYCRVEGCYLPKQAFISGCSALLQALKCANELVFLGIEL